MIAAFDGNATIASDVMHSGMVKHYPAQTIGPLIISATLGTAMMCYFFAVLGLNALFKVYVWPGLLLTIFWWICLYRRDFRRWHRIVWRSAQVWSGIWVVLFVLGITTLVFAFLFPMSWISETNFNPWLAVLIHALITACASDVLRMTRSEA